MYTTGCLCPVCVVLIYLEIVKVLNERVAGCKCFICMFSVFSVILGCHIHVQGMALPTQRTFTQIIMHFSRINWYCSIRAKGGKIIFMIHDGFAVEMTCVCKAINDGLW